MGIENSILIGLSRQVALKRQMEMVANNIANINTTAFRAEKILFREYLVETPEGDRMSYVEDYGVARDLRSGPLRIAIRTDMNIPGCICHPGRSEIKISEIHLHLN